MKEFEELDDRNSADLKGLQSKISTQEVNNIISAIEESVSYIDQLRWNEVNI
jgi:hypothetical protein